MNTYLAILQYVLENPQTFQSNHFRGNASFYAEAASRGHISCLQHGKNAGRWFITAAGRNFLEENYV